jgi:hypothetical protein
VPRHAYRDDGVGGGRQGIRSTGTAIRVLAGMVDYQREEIAALGLRNQGLEGVPGVGGAV